MSFAPRPGPSSAGIARDRGDAVPAVVGVDHRVRRDADREFRARLFLHGRRLCRLVADRAVRLHAGRLLGLGRRRRAGDGRAGGGDGGRAAAPALPLAGTVPAAGYLRRRAGGAGSGRLGLGAGGSAGPAGAGAEGIGRHPGPALPALRSGADRARAAGARGCCGCCSTAPVGARWSVPRRRTARWRARSASIRHGCSPASCSWAARWPDSAGRCRFRARR